MGMMAALDPMNNSTQGQLTLTTNREIHRKKMSQLSRWAADKIAEERLKRIEAKKKKRFNPPKNKTKKHVFNVTYLKGREPIFA